MDPKQNQSQPTVPVQPPVPVGGAKEAPVVKSQEWVTPSTPEIVLPKEVQDAGVEVKPLVEPVPQGAHDAGLRMANSITPPPRVAQETISIQTPRSVLHHLKKVHKSVKESLSWLVRLIIKEQDKKEKGAAV